MPHLALPSLTAYLRAQGVTVIQRDLNVDVFDTVLTREYLRQAFDRVHALHRRRSGRDGISAPASAIRWAMEAGPRLIEEVEAAREALCSPAFFDGPTGARAIETIDQAMQLASLPFHPASLEIQTYNAAVPVDSSRQLLQGVRDPAHNMFLDIYRRGILEEIKQEQPDVVGISIPCMAQMLPGMTLAYLIKAEGLPCHVTVGGPHISMLREQIPAVPRLFELIDSAVVFEGEEPLLRLVEALADGRDLSAVPNLIYRDGREIRVNERSHALKIRDLPPPDFDGLPLDRYLAPELVLPLLTARGCYFGRCAFCNVGYGERETFSQLQAERIVDQMLGLQERYGIRHIFFSDEAISPRNLKAMSAQLERLGAPVRWGGCVRFEKVITAELLQQMYRGGCRMILFGLESASEAIINKMVKGTELPHMSRILRESAEAGIWNHTFFFFGFPGETIEQAQETVNFLYSHQSYIHSAAFGTFLLERYSPAHQFPEAFGIRRIIEDPKRDLAIYFDYEVSSGMDERMADLVAERFLQVLPTKPYPQFYVNDIYRFLYASRLSDEGKALPSWLSGAQEAPQEA